MFSEFWAFLQIGFSHIVALDGADHILFLLALAAIYRKRDWRGALWVISAFTVGHSITLALAVTGLMVLPINIIEFLIPVTIIATGIENLVLRERAASGSTGKHRPVFAAIFGLVHGAGFADYLQNLFVDRIAVPLLAFNVGIELGQIVVLAFAAVLFGAADRAFRSLPAIAIRKIDPFQIRLVTVSAVVTVVATGWGVGADAAMNFLGRVLLLVAVVSGNAFAHPIHTTLTKVSVDRNSVTFNVRAFADDFSATVAKFAGRAAPADSSVVPAEVLRYARSFLLVTNAATVPVVLESCGIRRANELYWLCFRASFPKGSEGARIRNQMLTELHSDQVNIVQMEPPATRRTLLFTKNSPFAAIGP